MRVLLVSHRSLPKHPAGTEVHTHQLARALGAAGHEVLVLTAEKDPSRRHRSVFRREHDGVRYAVLVSNMHEPDFAATYASPAAEARFVRLLDEFRPDVVHAAHLLDHSLGYARLARERGLPFLLTLFDFWLQCPRFGQRRFVDGSLCATVERERCARCLASFKYAATPTERRVGRVLAAVRSLSGVDLVPLARRVAAEGGEPSSVPRPPSEPPADWLAALAERDRAVRDELVPAVSAFVAPSRFLAREFEAFGLPRERLHFLRTGIDLAPFRGFARRPSEHLRLAFVGTVVPHKGPHVLVEALERLGPDARASVEVHFHGPAEHAPRYAADLERRLERYREGGGRAHWHGRLERERLVEALADTDALVVPSLWYENAPLVILEALATGTPVVVSDLGGMAELARESGAGVVFPAGDADALAGLVEVWARDPGALRALASAAPAVRSIEDDARDFVRLYEEARGR